MSQSEVQNEVKHSSISHIGRTKVKLQLKGLSYSLLFCWTTHMPIVEMVFSPHLQGASFQNLESTTTLTFITFGRLWINTLKSFRHIVDSVCLV